jgi:hypothetical protein
VLRLNLQPQQHLFLVGQVADYPPEGKRERFDQGWRRQDFFVFRDFRVLLDIDDLEIVASFELLLAYATQVRDRRSGSRACAGYEELKQILRQVASSAVF